mmetsp:Transcript_42167/g.78891  ORF Transcript_42167/g.78891 Transcript_42167/m.78891 type:complete len:531 (-) Transcript_42167:18-1610(-)
MRIGVLVLACLAWTGDTRRVQAGTAFSPSAPAAPSPPGRSSASGASRSLPRVRRSDGTDSAKMLLGVMGGTSKGMPGPEVTIPDSAPSWDALTASATSTPTGKQLSENVEMRAKGLGPANTDAKLRLFDAKSEDEVRVTLYRDTAAWCPYCQKVWLLLEEKRIPFKVEKINMRSYGDKPASFLQKVPGGLLPAIELDGRLMTDSLPIMQVLDQSFPEGPQMVPLSDPEALEQANQLLRLERQLFGDWCGLTFRPGKGIMDAAEKSFMSTMAKVDAALLATPGPWFLGGDSPTLVDLQYISHIERMLASLLYWKGLKLRDTGEFKGLDAWLAAFEERPAYIATKSDYYTHVQDIPPQYGPGFGIDEAKKFADTIDGEGESWKLPLKLDDQSAIEPLAPLQWQGEEAARHEAAWKLTNNYKPVVRFAARGAAPPGEKQFQAPLADPYAQPAKELIDAVDVALRHVVSALLEGTEKAAPAAKADLGSVSKGDDAARLTACLVYLRDRIGVPRDMGQAAAFHLRAALNWAIDLL